jgi:hypothetical protein
LTCGIDGKPTLLLFVATQPPSVQDTDTPPQAQRGLWPGFFKATPLGIFLP